MRSSPQQLARLTALLALVLAPVGGFLFSTPAHGGGGPTIMPPLVISPIIVTYPGHLTLNTPVGSTPAPVAHPAAAGDVVINEVVTDPQTDWSSNGFNGVPGSGAVGTADEFVELYIKAAGLDLAGWTIALNDTSPASGDLTSAGAFQVSRYVGGGSFHATAAGAYVVLGSPIGSASMDNTISIVLKDGQGTVINQVQIGAGGAPGGNSTGPTDEAVARVPNGVDTGDDAADFAQQAATPGSANVPGSPPPSPTFTPSTVGTVATPTQTSTPTRTPTPTASEPGPVSSGVLLNEFLPRPGPGQQEFIELINLSAQTVDLGGWQLDDAPGGSKPYTLPGGTLIGAGGLIAFGQDVTGVALNNAGDTARLLHPDGSVADQWGYTSAQAGASWARIPDGGQWNPNGVPSPGGPNHLAPGPAQPDTVAIGDFRNWPDGAWVSVRAYVSVPPGVFSQRTIHIQDSTGGVTVYLGRDNWPPLVVGQPIRLNLAYVRHRGGEVQLYVRNGWHVHAGAGDVPVALQPWTVTTGQVGQANEGTLLMLNGRVTRLEAEAFWLDDGSGAARVFFAAATGLARPALQLGENWQVSGVVVVNTTANSSGPRYQLQPRDAADLAQIVGGQAIPYVPPAATAMPTATPEATATVEP
jgi:hypothetical protein